VDRQRVLHDLRRRDELDSSRSDGPLIRPHGAIVVDTTSRSVEQVVDELERIVRRELPGVGFKA
jgi:cytidylate kinase